MRIQKEEQRKTRRGDMATKPLLIRLLRPRCGSGTVSGLMLVMLAAALLGALCAGASVVVGRAESRQEADLAALSAASARVGLLPGSSPCERAAARTRFDPQVRVMSCSLQDSDVLVTVQTGSGPLARLTQMTSRAGPADCGSLPHAGAARAAR